MQALYELALEERSYVRTAVIAERLGLLEQQPEPRGTIHAANIVLAVCRRLNNRSRVKNGRPEGVVCNRDKTTGWMIGTGSTSGGGPGMADGDRCSSVWWCPRSYCMVQVQPLSDSDFRSPLVAPWHSRDATFSRGCQTS